MMRRLLALAFLLCASVGAIADEAVKPKLGPEATPITVDRDYLRTARAEDYWMLAAFYVPQKTSSDCSAASATIAVNALRGLPPRSDQLVVTEEHLLKDVADPKWSSEVVEDGPG